MGIFATSLWPDFVDLTSIIFLQECARDFLDHQFSICILAQGLFCNSWHTADSQFLQILLDVI